jgi:lipopolysaccharide export system permease protein
MYYTRMRLLSRYVCTYFLRYFSVGLLVCIGLVFIVDLFDSMDDFIARQVFWGDAIHYLLLRLPSLVYQIVPAIFLLASALTFSTLVKYNEIVAMRSSGIAPLRLARPIFLLGCIGGLLLLVAQEYLLPYTNQAYRLLWRTRIRHEPIAEPQGALQQGHFWYRAGSRIWSVEVGLPSAHRLLGVTIYDLDASGAIRQRYDAAEARWTPQGWILLQGMRRTFGTDEVFITPPEYFAQRQVDFAERFADMQTIRKEPEEMGLRELLAYAAQLQRWGGPATEYLVALHGKLAFAVLCVLMAGFGVPLALRLNRSGGTIRAVGLTLLCGFSYWVVHSLVLAMGHNGQLPPLVAAWSTSAGFGVGNVYFACRLR